MLRKFNIHERVADDIWLLLDTTKKKDDQMCGLQNESLRSTFTGKKMDVLRKGRKMINKVICSVVVEKIPIFAMETEQ